MRPTTLLLSLFIVMSAQLAPCGTSIGLSTGSFLDPLFFLAGVLGLASAFGCGGCIAALSLRAPRRVVLIVRRWGARSVAALSLAEALFIASYRALRGLPVFQPATYRTLRDGGWSNHFEVGPHLHVQYGLVLAATLLGLALVLSVDRKEGKVDWLAIGLAQLNLGYLLWHSLGAVF